ncbi:MAG: Non-canonical purine pyrophosphatase [Planctomycetaceae bacterium]|nr:Non-canonical purine pyrophosphatase [Planctomycetaceae bacterium]
METTPITVVLASRNRKKTGEMADLLQPLGIQLKSVGDFPDVPEVIEDGLTFGENAAKKASQTAQHVGCWTIGEDSGLMVDALDGRPGIYSARYSGPDATDEKNNLLLQKELAGFPPERRGAGYVCSVALADPHGTIRVQAEDRCRGRIIDEPRGANGFGYDPYFLILEYHRTFGELSGAVKQRLSHRARAFSRFIPEMMRILRAQ